jgi:hypothetical protein
MDVQARAIVQEATDIATLQNRYEKSDKLEFLSQLFERGQGLNKAEVAEGVQILLTAALQEKPDDKEMREVFFETITYAVLCQHIGDLVNWEALVASFPSLEKEKPLMDRAFTFLGFSGQVRYLSVLETYLLHADPEVRSWAEDAIDELTYRLAHQADAGSQREADLTPLTLLDDPLTYQAQANELVVQVPTDVSSDEELLATLQERLGLPAYTGTGWDVLREALCNWDRWTTIPRRIVLVHVKLPLFPGRLWWLHLQGYLHALLESITVFERRKALETNLLNQRELVVIFPSQVAEELRAVLTRPPDWELKMGRFEESEWRISEIDPLWSQILQHLRTLDGLHADACRLSREGVGQMTVHYLKDAQACSLRYQSANQEEYLIASLDSIPSLPPVVPLALVERALEVFYTTGQRLDTLFWLAPSSDAGGEEG